jgi:hypothetical protein
MPWEKPGRWPSGVRREMMAKALATDSQGNAKATGTVDPRNSEQSRRDSSGLNRDYLTLLAVVRCCQISADFLCRQPRVARHYRSWLRLVESHRGPGLSLSHGGSRRPPGEAAAWSASAGGTLMPRITHDRVLAWLGLHRWHPTPLPVGLVPFPRLTGRPAPCWPVDGLAACREETTGRRPHRGNHQDPGGTRTLPPPACSMIGLRSTAVSCASSSGANLHCSLGRPRNGRRCHHRPS